MEKRKKLLIVTGDSSLQEWLKAFFRQYEDVEGDILADAGEVRRRIEEARPDALLLDMAPAEGHADEDVLDISGLAELDLPVIAVTAGIAESRLGPLKSGAYACIDKPITSSEEVYLVVNNAIKEYTGRRKSAAAVSEMVRKREADRLGLLELELVKGLQHMIGETEEPAAIFKHAFSLIKNYLPFEVFAALAPRQGEFEIYVYPNVRLGEEIGEVITGTLIKKMTRLAEEEQERKVKVVVAGKAESRASSDDLKSVIVPLETSSRTCGYAGIYRGKPFDYEEESVFKRFCAHIATALEKINLFEEIKSLSVCDGLTGLYNHVSIVSKLEQEAQRSRRYGSPLSVIMFDLDNFKEVNDAYGHLAGDEVLVEVARLIRNGVRSIDSVGRYGGEEFLVILPETDVRDAAVIADRLRQRLAGQTFPHEGREIRASISGGVAGYREEMDAGRLIGAADELLYQAKSEGKNMVRYEER
jgi:diguanylate cyclase (GGDEF)-like protein